MNPSTQVVSPLLQRMIEDMRLRKLNGKTQIAYVRAVRRLTGFLRRSPDTATGKDLRRFQLHMVDQGTSSHKVRRAPNRSLIWTMFLGTLFYKRAYVWMDP